MISWPWRKRASLTVTHLRYTKVPAINPRDKALAMAKAMGRDDLVARLTNG